MRARSAIGWLASLLIVCAATAHSGAAPQSGGHALLDVPYLSQPPDLCGGAAVAMLMRYWGARDVFPQDFVALVGPHDGGIVTTDLATAVRARGWQAVVAPVTDGDARERVRSAIDGGHPIIALIEVGPRTYHYVVVVGMTDRQVVIHDPARAPFRVLPWIDFDAQWAATSRWMMLVLPPPGFRAQSAEPTIAARASVQDSPSDVTPCRALVDRGVDLALAGDAAGAEQGLTAATTLCPDDAAAWRELAGLRFSESRWSDAEALASSAVRLAPDDVYAWQLVATSRYLSGDLPGALAAWNHASAPHVDTVDISGATRTRQPIIANTIGLEPRQLLTREAFARALRRVREMPAAANARMNYESIDGGLARVRVFFDERPLVPTGWATVVAMGGRALIRDEVQVDVAGLLGLGELETAAWRWSTARPQVALSLAVPSAGLVPGVISFDGLWEQQSYALGSAGAVPVREPRRRVGARIASWSTSWLKWQAGAALDRLREPDPSDTDNVEPHDYANVSGGIDVRLASDRLAIALSGGWWVPAANGDQFATSGLALGWRSTADAAKPFWQASAGVDVASLHAPLAVWSGAGTGQGRAPLLRAHPLLDDDVLTGQFFGRTLAHATFEYERPVGRTIAGRISVAGFLDAGRAWHRLGDPASSSLAVDGGIGLRVQALGSGGAIRVDLAHGLSAQGLTVLSAGWVAAWPR